MQRFSEDLGDGDNEGVLRAFLAKKTELSMKVTYIPKKGGTIASSTIQQGRIVLAPWEAWRTPSPHPKGSCAPTTKPAAASIPATVSTKQSTTKKPT